MLPSILGHLLRTFTSPKRFRSQAPNYQSTWLALSSNHDICFRSDLPIVLLGKWCLDESSKFTEQHEFHDLLPGCFHTPENAVLSRDISLLIYNEYLLELSNALNKIHNKSLSHKSWEVLVGPWLIYYISQLVPKYWQIKQAFHLYPNLTTSIIDYRSYSVPRGWNEYQTWFCFNGDKLSIQDYSLLISREYGLQPNTSVSPILYESQSSRKLSKFLKKLSWHIFSTLKRNKYTLLKDSYFSFSDAVKLFALSTGKVVEDFRPYEEILKCKTDWNLRKELESLITKPQAPDTFTGILPELIASNIPYAYLEAYDSVGKETRCIYPASPKSIFTSNALFYDERFKRLAADNVDAGLTISICQHGGNSGSYPENFLLGEVHELSVADRFYSWGWKSESRHNIVPMPSPKLNSKKFNSRNESVSGILFTTTSILSQEGLDDLANYTQSGYNDYITGEMQFAENLSEIARNLIRVRINFECWGLSKQWRSWIPGVKIENSTEVSYLHSLKDSSLNVCHGVSSTIMESFVNDCPTLILFNPEFVKLRRSSAPMYDLLREAGILHYDPKSAAHAVNSIIESPRSWWEERARSKAVKKFCTVFAHTSPEYLRMWAREFTNP